MWGSSLFRITSYNVCYTKLLRNVEQLVRKGLVRGPADFYRLDAERLAELEGWGEKSAKKLLAAVVQKKQLSLGRLIAALGIRHVGEVTASLLGEHFSELDALVAVDKEQLLHIERNNFV